MARTKTMSVIDRLFSRTKIPYHKDGTQNTNKCWDWTGAKNNSGYGMMKVDQEINMVTVHRIVAVEYKKCMNYGDKIEVLHTCGNKLCVNPHHLKTGNVKDRFELMAEYNAFNQMFNDKKFMWPVCEHCGETTYRPHFKRIHAFCDTLPKTKYNTSQIIRKSKC